MSDWLMKPTLAEPIHSDGQALVLLQRAEWRAEQKLDGVRLVIHTHDGKVVGINRKGNPTLVPRNIQQAFAAFDDGWIFDGELIKGTFWIFDLVKALDVVGPNTPYSERRFHLENLWPDLEFPPCVRLLPSYTDEVDKIELAMVLREAKCEGVMLKDGSATYHPGSRTFSIRKWKFYETVDVVVLETWREGKQSMGVGLIDPRTQELVDVGSVAMTPTNLAKVEQFDVCEVKYLYVDDPIEPRLYQPAFIRKRDDKDPYECLMSQLKFTNKSVQLKEDNA